MSNNSESEKSFPAPLALAAFTGGLGLGLSGLFKAAVSIMERHSHIAEPLMLNSGLVDTIFIVSGGMALFGIIAGFIATPKKAGDGIMATMLGSVTGFGIPAIGQGMHPDRLNGMAQTLGLGA